MSIVDEVRTKNIAVRTPHGEVYFHNDFIIENNTPLHGLVRIKDNTDGRIYWFNIDHVVWIGPR